MTDTERERVDISFEQRVAAEGPGVRQRALAIAALVTVSELFGNTPTEAQIEAIRGLSKQEAKAARIALEATVALLPAASVTVETDEKEKTPIVLDAEVSTTEPVDAVEEVVEVPAIQHEVQVDTDPKAEVEAEATAQVPEVIEVQPETDPEKLPLNDRATKWLSGIYESDRPLVVGDAKAIAQSLVESYGPSKRTKINYYNMTELFLRGYTYAEIAEVEASTEGTISQTITNLKTKARNALKNPSSDPILAQAPVETKKPTPVPSPPKTAFANKPQAPVEVQDVSRETLAVSLETIKNAVKTPAIVSEAEWHEAAELAVTNLAGESGLTAQEATTLWAHLHRNETDAYKQNMDEFVQVLDKLRPGVTALLRNEYAGQSPQKTALTTLFLNFDGNKDLDTVFGKLRRAYADTSKTTSQRVAVLAVTDLMKHGLEIDLDTTELSA